MGFFSPLGGVFYFLMQLFCALIPRTVRGHRLHTPAPLRAGPSARDAAGSLAAAPTQSIAAPAAGTEAVPTGHAIARSLGAGRGRRQRRNDVLARPVRTPLGHARPKRTTHPRGHLRPADSPQPPTQAATGQMGACRRRHRACTRRRGGCRCIATCRRPRQRRPPRDRWARAPAAAEASTGHVGACRRRHRACTRRRGGRLCVATCRRPRQPRPPRDRWARAPAAAAAARGQVEACRQRHRACTRRNGGRRCIVSCRRPRQRRPLPDRWARAPAAAAAATGEVGACRRSHRARAHRHEGHRYEAPRGRQRQRRLPQNRCAQAPAADAASERRVRTRQRRPPPDEWGRAAAATAPAAAITAATAAEHRVGALGSGGRRRTGAHVLPQPLRLRRRYGGRRCIATCGRPGQRWPTRDRCARAPAAGAAAAGQVGECRRHLSHACARRHGGRRYVAAVGRSRLGRGPLNW